MNILVIGGGIFGTVISLVLSEDKIIMLHL